MQRRPIRDPVDPTEVEAFVAALRRGQLVVLPTETVYGLAADARNPAAVDRLQRAKGRQAAQPFTHHLASIKAIEELAAPLPARVQRFLARVWPGPLTAIVASRQGATPVGLRVPAHPFTNRVIESLGHSLFMTSVNRAGEPPLNDPDAIAAAFGSEAAIELLADAGPPQLGDASAIVRFDGRRLAVLRTGILDAQQLAVGFAAKVVFVCTGNTCRSPLAEVLARHLAGQRLGVADDQVLAHGLCFGSAGTGTLSGMPASSGSLTTAAERDLDLSAHRSTQFTPELAAAADRIYCLSQSHHRAVLTSAPDAKGKTFLLDPTGGDVADPFGAPVEVYRRTRAEIESLLAARMDEFFAL